jgi:hypothetical protein
MDRTARFPLTLICSVGLFVTVLGSPTQAQSPGSEEGFMKTAIPENYRASFRCVQTGGSEFVVLNDVRTIAPDRVQGTMTFSINTGDGYTHLIYLGDGTDCHLEIKQKEP